MAFDERLAERVRDQISVREGVTERKMFGSLCFLVGGNLAVCVREEELLVRLDPAVAELAVKEDGVRVAEMGSREMKGWIFVSADRTSGERELAEWMDEGADRRSCVPPTG